MNRREFLAVGAAACVSKQRRPAQIAITLDLEMSRNFPKWEDTHWDYEKGNLNPETKRYAREACRRIGTAGCKAHCFVVGRVLEQEDIGWLHAIAKGGHALGNHTYDHVNMRATRLEEAQFRFQRAPWLVAGKSVEQVLSENVRMASAAMRSRLGVNVEGFRTPGGFHDGLALFPRVRQMLRDQGFDWISSKYPRGALAEKGKRPDDAFFKELLDAQQEAQPFAYPDGMIEVPMSPISDIVAFRGGQWKLDWFLEAISRALDWTINEGKCFDFLCHPSCLYVVDPEFRAIDLICKKVRAACAKAQIVTLTEIAKTQRVQS